MKNKICNMSKFLFISIFAITCLVGCKDNKQDLFEKSWEECKTVEEKVEYQMNHMSLEEKIGQMMIISYRSSKMDDTLKNALINNKPGGFILFKENFGTYEETTSLIEEIKSTSKIPMFMSIDQEGGVVQRLLALKNQTVTNIPHMYYLGKTEDQNLSYEVGKVMAEELRAIGVNLDFAPSIDIFSNPQNTVIGKRSFGENPDLVSKMALSLASGLEDNKVTPVFKHFPGHGDTGTDSHYALPVVTKTKEELLNFELIPFKNAIDKNAKIIMIGHLAVPSITKDNTPASLSKAVITDFLKNELNYKGLVITDALDMGAITNQYEEKDVYTMAIQAGVDILLMPKSSTRALQYIKESINEKAISEEQINNSVRKILTLKYSDIVNSTKLEKEYLGSLEHKKVIDQIKLD